MKREDKFIYDWESKRRCGIKKYIVKYGILKTVLSWNFILLLVLPLMRKIKFMEFLYINGLWMNITISSICIGIGGYYLGRYQWKSYSSRYVKIQLERLMKNREDILVSKE